MNFEKFTIKSQEALQKSAEIAMSLQQQAIEPGHFSKPLSKQMKMFRIMFLRN